MSKMDIAEAINYGIYKCIEESGRSPYRVVMSVESFRELQAECTRYELTKSNSGNEFKNRIYGVEIEFDNNLGNLIVVV